MGYTGYLVIQYVDNNPESSGYGNTWTERVLDTDSCPTDDGGQWVEISEECQMDTSGYTGYKITTYQNDVTGELSSTTVSDTGCTASARTYNDEEIWVNSGEPYCQIDEEGLYTGKGVQLKVQRNFNLINYGDTLEVEVEMPECSANTSPNWEEISRQCHAYSDEFTCYLVNDGTADILQIDTNPSSPTFNTTRTINVESDDCICEVCDSIEYSWRYVDDICGIQMPSNYNLSGLTDNTVYHVYRQYATCIIGGESGRTRPTTEFSAVTYQTNVDDCVYRWVENGETACFEDTFKFKASYSGGETYSAACNDNAVLDQHTTKPCDYNYSAMTSAEVGTCIAYLEDNYGSAFENCISLTSVTLPPTIVTIGPDSFQGCKSLPSIDIPFSVTSIGSNAFAQCYSLSSITIPNSVTSIDNRAFSYCSGLTSCTLPSGLNEIKNSTFEGCRSLTSITIPDSVTSIGDWAFENCSGLTSCTIGNSVTRIGMQAFQNCVNLTSINIPDSVTIIDDRAFRDCYSLSSVTIPSGVTYIGISAFVRCSGLTSITINITTPPDTCTCNIVGQGSCPFNNTNECPIYVPANSVNAYKAAWPYYAPRIRAIPNS